MIRLLTLAFGVALTVPAGALGAQRPAAPDTDARRRAMDRLSFLEGDWIGPATVMVGSGQTVDMQQTEWVRRKVGGQVLLIEGLGRRMVNGQPTDTAFNAVATIDWLPDRGYLMRSYVLQGHQSEFPVTVRDSGFVWGFTVPGGQVRYTMRLTPAGEWHERGEFSQDGEQWRETLEMRLRKISDAK